MRAIHFGAGNIGRGFIGIILKENNYELIFVDVNNDLIDAIKRDNTYIVKVLNENKDEIKVEGVSGLHGVKEQNKIVEEISNVDLITTSLGQENLKHIKDTIVKGLENRMKNNINTNLDIIACENGIKVSSVFKDMILSNLNQDIKTYVDKYVSFVDSAVDRIVPNQVNENILDVQVEETFEWVVDSTQIKQNKNLEGVVYTDNLLFFNKRKLLTVNFAHAYIGYMGYAKGYKYVSEALKNKEVYDNAKKALEDIKDSLTYEFNFSNTDQDAYINKTLKRFTNELIVDEVTRVARNPKTKLAKEERFVSPLIKLAKNNKEGKFIVCAIAYALNYDYKDDPQAMEVQEIIKNLGIEEAIKEITTINDSIIISKIVAEYYKINKNKNF